jgi:hypothetical protein
MNRPLQALLLSAALAACATPSPMQWEKTGATAAAVNEDSEQCRQQARFARMPESVMAPPARSVADRGPLTREEELVVQERMNFQACMREKGYSAKR